VRSKLRFARVQAGLPPPELLVDSIAGGSGDARGAVSKLLKPTSIVIGRV
jgi:hypothetical protein